MYLLLYTLLTIAPRAPKVLNVPYYYFMLYIKYVCMYVQLAYTYIPCCQYISICVHVCICACSMYISVSVYVWTYICTCFYRSEFIRPLLSILFRNDLYSKYQVCLYVYVLYVVNCGCADCVKL